MAKKPVKIPDVVVPFSFEWLQGMSIRDLKAVLADDLANALGGGYSPEFATTSIMETADAAVAIIELERSFEEVFHGEAGWPENQEGD